MFKKRFKTRGRRELSAEADRESAGAADQSANARKVAYEITRLFDHSDKARESLRRRVALARAREAVDPSRNKPTVCEKSAEINDSTSQGETLLRAAKELFPSGLREANAIAVRLTLARAGAGDRKMAEEALKSVIRRRV